MSPDPDVDPIAELRARADALEHRLAETQKVMGAAAKPHDVQYDEAATVLAPELHADGPIGIVAAGGDGGSEVPGPHNPACEDLRCHIQDVDAADLEQAALNRPRRLLILRGPAAFADSIPFSQQRRLVFPLRP